MKYWPVSILTASILLLAAAAGLADAKADRVLRQSAAALKAARTMSVVLHKSYSGHAPEYIVSEIHCMRPNYLRADIWRNDTPGKHWKHNRSVPHEIYSSDGKTMWHIGRDGSYAKQSSAADGSDLKF